MNVSGFSRVFRLSSSGVACDEQGLRVCGVPLLARDANGEWTALEESELQRDLSLVYGFPVRVATKRAGLAAVASALQAGNLAKAQIAALLLRLPDPPPHGVSGLAKADRRPLAEDLVACGLLKADDDFDEQHPRTGVPPNPGWFAAKPKAPTAPPEQ